MGRFIEILNINGRECEGKMDALELDIMGNSNAYPDCLNSDRLFGYMPRDRVEYRRMVLDGGTNCRLGRILLFNLKFAYQNYYHQSHL